jgi:ribonuclease HII
VVAAAVILPRGFRHPEIKDSKLLTPKQREKLALLIRANAVLIDGNQRIPAEFLHESKCFAARSLYQKTIISGDQICISIAAASIIAKVARDEMMVELDKIHRQTFQPVRDAAMAQETSDARARK